MEDLVARTLRSPRDQRRREGGRAQGSNRHAFCELESLILRDSPEPWQSKAPDVRPTIKKIKEVRKRNRSRRKASRWHREANGDPHNGNKRPFNCRNTFAIEFWKCYKLKTWEYFDVADVISNISPIICFVKFLGFEFGICKVTPTTGTNAPLIVETHLPLNFEYIAK